jgi:hypothetical protein
LYQEYQGLLYNHVDDQTFYANTTNVQEVATKILTKLKAMPKGPGFLLAGYQRLRSDETIINNNNPADLTIPRLQTIMQIVGQDPEIGKNIEFVTPEKFTALIKKSIKTTSVQKEESSTLPPLIYSLNQEIVRLSFPTSSLGYNEIKIFDLEGREIQSIMNNTQIIDINLKAQQRKYILRLMNNEAVKSYLFIH